jgi:hypothetical protein
MDFDHMEFELAVQEAVKAELEHLERERRFSRQRQGPTRQRGFGPGRPWWVPFAVVALALINTLLWPIAFGLAAGIVISLFLLLRSVLAS